MLAQTFFGAGLTGATPLFALVNVDRLDLSLADVGSLGVVSAIATTLSFLAWGVAADRFRSPIPLRLGSAIGLGGLVAYALAPGIAALWVATAALGACNSAIELGFLAAISEGTTLATRSRAQSGLNALLGVRALVAAFVASALVQADVVDLTGALVICCGLSAAGVVLFLMSGRRCAGPLTPSRADRATTSRNRRRQASGPPGEATIPPSVREQPTRRMTQQARRRIGTLVPTVGPARGPSDQVFCQ
jgi:hypothetical protein